LTVATPEQYSVFYPLVAASRAPTTVDELSKIAATLPLAELGSVERVPFGQRRASAAVTLLRLGEREKVLPVFEMQGTMPPLERDFQNSITKEVVHGS